ncbi:ribosomal protein L4 [Punctularia strigosozonata HHB-11173 SS5]|uniref:ribosomal protein L4 n=1 Tax=Punctularia strigosozonata (strain HHB-11173) TaxID=741275 RepID=UPI0004418238|nr:ribosomal protein L4 [Punctularia strigosozonata HHB-11173 SS5]EIN13810.1 ribosomal protein L4 [Punctularia strigosozonata HHB-11173 SS5]
MSKAKPLFREAPAYISLSQLVPPEIMSLARIDTDIPPPSHERTSSLFESESAAEEPSASAEESIAGATEALDKVVALDPTVFLHPIRKDILHLCVVHHLDGLRQGSANTKTRSEVAGSGRKLRPQKGTGRARLGDNGSPMLKGGGVAFGPKPRDFSTKLPRKVIQMGMRIALSAKVHEKALGVVDTLDWPLEVAKTKAMARRIDELGWRRTLFVSGGPTLPEGLRRCTSNLENVDAVTAEELTVYDATRWPRLVLDIDAVAYFEQTLSRADVAGG